MPNARTVTMKPSSYSLWKRARRLRTRATGELLASAASAALRILAWPWRVARARRELSMLMSLSDHQLRDIGVMPHDLVAASNLPLGEDAAEYVAREVSERRRARLSQRRAANCAMSRTSPMSATPAYAESPAHRSTSDRTTGIAGE